MSDPNTRFSSRVTGVEPSSTLALNQKAKAMAAEGRSMVNLTAGEPDFPTPARIIARAKGAMDEGHTKYSASRGIAALREGVAEQVGKATYHREFNPKQVMITCGAKQAIFNACLALLDQGDEAVIIAPYWVSYVDMVKIAGGTPVVVEAKPEDGFVPDLQTIASKINDRSRLLILNSPNNPTGAIYPSEFLDGLAKLMAKFPRLTVLSDDIYEKLIFDGRKFDSIAMSERNVPLRQLMIVNGVSKAYAMTGWRIGYVLADEEMIRVMDILQSQSITHVAPICQWGAVEALEGDQSDVEEMRASFEKRRNLIWDRLHGISGVRCAKAEGAFYVFPDISSHIGKTTEDGKRIDSDVAMCGYLLEEHGLALVPGSAFGANGFVRISYAASVEELEEGMRRLKLGLGSLR